MKKKLLIGIGVIFVIVGIAIVVFTAQKHASDIKKMSKIQAMMVEIKNNAGNQPVIDSLSEEIQSMMSEINIKCVYLPADH